jgi:hypothetical protein
MPTSHRGRHGRPIRSLGVVVVASIVTTAVALLAVGVGPASATDRAAGLSIVGSGITGTVTGGGAGLAGIDVRVYDAATQLVVAKTTTVAGGAYEVAVPAGTYLVRFSDAAGSWRLTWYADAPTLALATPVTVPSGATAVADAELTPSSTLLSGKVETFTNDVFGLYRIDVRVYDATTSLAVAKTRTDVNGAYHVADLPPGRYLVRFSDPGGVYGLTWYPTAGTIRGALPVVVTAGARVSADVRMYTTGWIRGVVHSGSAPVAGIEVRLFDANTGASVVRTSTGTDGSYRFDDLHLGGYGGASFKVRFLDPTGTYATQWAEGQATARTAAVLKVDAYGDPGKQADADLVPAAGSLTGSVSDGTSGLAGISVRVWATAGQRVAGVTSGPDGSWSVNGLPIGTYRVELADDAGAYLPVWFASAPTFAAATPVTVTAGATTAIGDQVLTAAAPLSLVVDTAVDGHDAAPGDGVCDDGSGACPLRAAVDEANANPSADTITIAAGVDPTLTIAGAAEDGNATGDLDSSGDLTIHGNGSTLDAGGLDRALQQLGRLRIDHLTITGGTTEADHLLGRGDDGGAILAYGAVTLTDTTLTANRAVRFTSGRGGGIAVIGNFTMVRGLVTNNVSDDIGGGIWALGAVVTITDSTIDGNQTFIEERDAGGNGGSAALHIGSNEAHGGTATVSGTTISNNVSTLCCGSQSGGGLIVQVATATVVDTSIVGNAANNYPWSFVTIGGGAGVSGDGGHVALINSTIADNTGYEGIYQILPMGGTGPFTVEGSIVVGALPVCNGAWFSLGWNVLSDTSCHSPFLNVSDRIVTDALLGPLADNGGLTRTRLPLPGSPALDAVPSGTPTVCDGTYGNDQRGVARPQGTGCDIGAVERSP